MSNLLEHFHYWQKGGFLLIPIAIVCFLIWFYFLTVNSRLKKALSAPRGLEDEIEARLAQGQELDKTGESVFSKNHLFVRVLAYAFEKVQRALDVASVFEEIRQKEVSPFQRDLLVLQALVTSAPLLGLLGTVLGMIETFHVIAMKTSWTTEMMASGIGQALITTQFGLVVALPGIFGISVLQKKMRQLDLRLWALQLHLTMGFRRRNK